MDDAEPGGLGGRKAALEALYRAHADDIARFVRLRLGQRSASTNDVCQEVWAAATRALASQGGVIPGRAWLFGIARHKTIDAWRDDGGMEPLDTQLRPGGA